MKLGGGAIVVRALEDEGVGFAFGISRARSLNSKTHCADAGGVN